MFTVTQPYLDLLVKPRIFFQVFWKLYSFMHFERHFCHKKEQKKCVPKAFRHVTLNTLIFLLGLSEDFKKELYPHFPKTKGQLSKLF